MRRMGKKNYRHFTREFKVAAVARMEAGENISALGRELKVSRSVINRWRDAFLRVGPEGLRDRGRPARMEAQPVRAVATPEEVAARRVAELERKVGQQALLIDFLKRAFKRVEGARRNSTGSGVTASTGRSGQ